MLGLPVSVERIVLRINIVCAGLCALVRSTKLRSTLTVAVAESGTPLLGPVSDLSSGITLGQLSTDTLSRICLIIFISNVVKSCCECRLTLGNFLLPDETEKATSFLVVNVTGAPLATKHIQRFHVVCRRLHAKAFSIPSLRAKNCCEFRPNRELVPEAIDKEVVA